MADYMFLNVDIKRFVVFVSYDDKPFGVIEDILKAHGNEINYM